MKNKIIITLILMAALCWFTQSANAQEAKYYALFVAKFSDYIQWPNAKTPIVIGVYGNQEIITELEGFTSKKQNIQIAIINSIQDVNKCQIVFLGDAMKGEFESIRASIDKKEILLVTENENFAERGAAISFYLDGTKLRFRLNKRTIETQNLKVSGSLLSLADVI